MIKKITASVCLTLAACLCLASCGGKNGTLSMKIPETDAETQTAAYASGSTPEELTEAKALLQKAEEVSVSPEANVSADEGAPLESSLAGSFTDVEFSYGGEKTLEINSDHPEKNLTLNVESGAGLDFGGNLGIITIGKCEGYMLFSGSADTLVLKNPGASCEITGSVKNLIIYGKDTTVKYSGSAVPGSVLAANPSSVIINSTDTDMSVCLSNGVLIALPAHATLDVSTLTVAAHK